MVAFGDAEGVKGCETEQWDKGVRHGPRARLAVGVGGYAGKQG